LIACLFSPRGWEQLIRLSANRAIVDESKRGEEIETDQQTRIYFSFGGVFGGGSESVRFGEGVRWGAALVGWDADLRDQQGYLFVLF
jgi:hypothetical protein